MDFDSFFQVMLKAKGKTCTEIKGYFRGRANQKVQVQVGLSYLVTRKVSSNDSEWD